LSGNSVTELLAGHRVEEDPNKRSPLDFTLWKRDPRHIMQWDSPFGRGFPGWHIECSAMSRKYLGRVFDIHTGGEDNIFPHHECEIAQSSGGEGTICARYWLHRRYILVDGRKMSKSQGNFYTVRDLVAKGYTGPEVRLALLSTHYRTNSNFTLQGLDASRETLRYLREFRRNMLALPQGDGGEAEDAERVRGLASSQDAAFRAGLDDDLNISAALAAVHGFVGESYKTAKTLPAGRCAVDRLEAWDRVLGVLGESPPADAGAVGEIVGSSGLRAEEIERLVESRLRARSRKDFAEADRIRDHLRERGIVLKDSPQGTRWEISGG
jgi:cysteinyl-tRNA synthetase